MMKKAFAWKFFIVLCLILIFLLSGCEAMSNEEEYSGVYIKDYYDIEDFKSITIGESTFADVYKVATTEKMHVTSYGGFCEYPMQNGGYICIKFYGKDLIVGAIEEH